MQDRPTAKELVEAVGQFLNLEIAPTLRDPRLKFRTLVAANVLNVVARELELGDAQVWAEYERLKSLITLPLLPTGEGGHWKQVERMTRELSRRIRAGEADEGAFHDAVFAHVEQTVIEKLQVANPRYLAKQGE